MVERRVLFSWIAILLAAALIMAACGSSSGLKTLTISPATADAKNFPNGQVQFTAMGSYGGSTQTTTVNALWWDYTPWATPPPSADVPVPIAFTLTASGVAQCVGGTGTFTIWATAPANQNIQPSQMNQFTDQLTATAQLTCP